MVRRRRNRIGFWLFAILLALGAGWAANHDWRFPLVALMERLSEPDEAQQEAAETDTAAVAEQSSTDQPATAQPSGETPAEDASTPATEGGDKAVAAADEEGAPSTQPEQTAAGDTGSSAPTTVAAATDPSNTEPPTTAAVVTEPEDSGADATTEAAAPEAETTPAEAATDLAEQENVAETEPTVAVGTEPAAPDAGSDQDLAAAAVTPPALDLPDLGSPDTGTSDTDLADVQPGAGPPDTSPSDIEPADAALAPSTSDATPTDAAPDQPAGTTPSFDIVRVEPDGRAVIAGRAAPGAEVVVRSSGEEIDRVRASRRGEWVAIPVKPLRPGDRQLTAVVEQDGGPEIESAQVVVVAVPGSTAAEPQASATEATQPTKPLAVLLPRGGKGPGRILQAPGRLSAEGTLALMTVSYDDGGQILLSGEAPPGVPVRIYVDNRPAALVVGDAKGGWSSELDKELSPGTYTLRLDQLDAKGRTVARIETPFTRVSEPPVEGQLEVDYVVVQPGNSLWRIARRLSGNGLDYVYIFDANQAQIRDPDLIFPGQVFEIPTEVATAG